MEIGGYDLVLENPGLTEGECLKRIRQGIQEYWPNMVEEKDESDGEYFFYEDQDSQNAWDEFNNEENNSKMIYVIFKEEEITLVHEQSQEMMNRISDLVLSW